MTTTDDRITTGPVGAADDVEAQIEAFADQLFGGVVAAFEILTVYQGHQLGLYGLLAERGPSTPVQLAEAAGIDRRYAREWLEQQAVAGIVTVSSEPAAGGPDAVDPDARVFSLPEGHAEVLVNRDSLAYLAPFTGFLVGAGKVADRVVDAYRTGAGISFGDYGDEVRIAQAEANRPAYVNLLGSWLATMPDVVAVLQADRPALVADVGCGVGWSTIALAQAFPRVHVHGIDLDEASIREARANAVAEGVTDRVTFEVRDAADAAPGAYDLVCMMEALHDTGRPVDVLAALRTMAGPDGTVLVMDENVSDHFEAPGSPVERMLYAASALHCLPVGRSGDHDHATGTMLRTPLLRELAAQAGYQRFEILPIEHEFWRFYRLGS